MIEPNVVFEKEFSICSGISQGTVMGLPKMMVEVMQHAKCTGVSLDLATMGWVQYVLNCVNFP